MNFSISGSIEGVRVGHACLEGGPPRMNSAGRLAFNHTSEYVTGPRYYCGALCRVRSDPCSCGRRCERCGPTGGCPCGPCRQLGEERIAEEDDATDATVLQLGYGGSQRDLALYEEWLYDCTEPMRRVRRESSFEKIEVSKATLDDIFPHPRLPNNAAQFILLTASEFYALLSPEKSFAEVFSEPVLPHKIVILKNGRGAYVAPEITYTAATRSSLFSKNIDINSEQLRKLEQGVRIAMGKYPAVRNVLGHLSFYSPTGNAFYCGRFAGADLGTSDGHCGPDRGPMCAACGLILGIGQDKGTYDRRWRPLVYGGYHWQQRQHPVHAVWDPSTNPMNPMKRFTFRDVARADGVYVLLRLAGFVTDIAREIAAFAVDVDTAESEVVMLLKHSPLLEESDSFLPPTRLPSRDYPSNRYGQQQ